MNQFVLDNSVAMRWLLASPQQALQDYAHAVLQSMTETGAVVPNLWHLEAVNVLVVAERKADVEVSEVERFIAQLEELPISVDLQTSQRSFNRILSLTRAYNLSSYDAAYLELAIRENLPLASLDKALIKAAKKAAKKAGIPVYLTGHN